MELVPANLTWSDLGNDNVFSEKSGSYLVPNFGIGVYYYTRKFYAGLSVPILLGYKSNPSGEIVAYHDFKKYAYYLNTGVKIDIATNWQIEPSALLEYDRAGGIIIDAGLGLIYRDMMQFGLSYRSKQAVVMLFDFKITQQLKLGLAYDYGISGLNSYNRNSFEIALEYNFGYKIKAANPTIF